MNLYLEIFGYIGTILVILSMMMSSVTKLRVINICGSLISAVYAGISGTWPICVMNICLIIINLFHLIKRRIHKNELILIEVNHNDNSLNYFINMQLNNIRKKMPNFNINILSTIQINLIYSGCEIIGIMGGNSYNSIYNLELLYIIPKYQDDTIDDVLFTNLQKEHIKEIRTNCGEKNHNYYLEKLGFKNHNNLYIKYID